MSLKIDETEFEKWIKRNKGELLDIYISGQVLGGKSGEAPQEPKDFEIIDNTILITFHGTERLWIKQPLGISIDKRKLSVENATEITWGWHYYGRPQTEGNWCERVYTIMDKKVIRTSKTPPDGKLSSESIDLQLQTPILIIKEVVY